MQASTNSILLLSFSSTHPSSTRKRKMVIKMQFSGFLPIYLLPVYIQRCDGVKPACQQCMRAKKADGCEYDDGKGKTRTQILRETIIKLEHRIRELEDPEYVSTSITLYDPNLHSRSNSSSSSLGSPESSYLSASHSPFPSGSWWQPIDVKRAHCHNIDSSPPPGSWSQIQVGLSRQTSSSYLISHEGPTLTFIDTL